MRSEHGLERLPTDIFCPHSDAPIVFLDPVDDEDVGMPHARKTPGFLQRSSRQVGSMETIAAGKLQGDLALENGLERTVDLSEAPLADLLEHAEGTPWEEGGRLIVPGQSIACRVRSVGFEDGHGSPVRTRPPLGTRPVPEG